MPEKCTLVFRVAFSLIAAVLLNASKAAHSQDDNRVFDRHIKPANLVFTASDVYVVGPSARLCDGATTVFADPRGRYALISRRDEFPSRNDFLAPPVNAEMPQRDASLLLYDSQTGKTTMLWQRTLPPGELGGVSNVEWLTGKDVALVSVGSETSQANPLDPSHAPKGDFFLLEVHPNAVVSGLTRTLLHSDFSISALPSPNNSVALIREQRIETDTVSGQAAIVAHYRTLNTAGVVGPPLRLGLHASGGYQWNDTGDIAYLVDTIPPADNAPTDSASPAQTAPAPAAKPTRQWYALAVETGRLTPIEKRPKPTPPVEGIKAGSQPGVPVRLVGEAAVIAAPSSTTGQADSHAAPTSLHATEKLWPLWLQRRGAPAPSEHYPTAALIAADAGEATMLPDTTAILYVSEGALYAVPLTHQPRADVEGAYRKYLQQKTLSNAKQIALSILMYSQDYDENYPSVVNVLKAIAPYMRDDSVVNNPETGQLGFVYLMNGESMASLDSPATTVMGYLSGPGGRAAIFADGHAKWQPDVNTGGAGN